MVNYQIFTYNDLGNQFIGERDLRVKQIMIPVTYNFLLYKRSRPEAERQLKVGYLWQFNELDVTNNGILPEYSIKKSSRGVALGYSSYPYQFSNGSKLGYYIDAYLGTPIYFDYYNQEVFPMPSTSFVKLGIRYRFKGRD